MEKFQKFKEISIGIELVIKDMNLDTRNFQNSNRMFDKLCKKLKKI